MENTKTTFTPEESLLLISQTIAGYKSTQQKNNYYFLLWGWIISIASITHFALLRILLRNELYENIPLYSWTLWAIFVFTGMIIQYIHIYRVKKQTRVRSHLERYMSILWQVSGAAMITAGIISYLLQIDPGPLVLTIAGLSTLVTGLQIRFRPLIIGGILLMLSAVAASLIKNEYQLLLNAGAIICGYMIPGYMLNSSKS
jgi:hypothetical protein